MNVNLKVNMFILILSGQWLGTWIISNGSLGINSIYLYVYTDCVYPDQEDYLYTLSSMYIGTKITIYIYIKIHTTRIMIFIYL